MSVKNRSKPELVGEIFMKILVGLILIIILIGCQGIATFEPVTISGFELEVHLEQHIEQGDHVFSETELQYLLPDLVLNTPVQNFTFYLELYFIELEEEFTAEEINEIAQQLVPETRLVKVDAEGVFGFGEIIFEYAGSYAFRIAQITDGVTDWQLDDVVFNIEVNVVEDTGNNVLVAYFSAANIGFTNIFIHDLVEEIAQAVEEQYQARLVAMDEELAEIEEAFLSLGGHTSFYFHNLETGFRHGFNENHIFPGASTPKVWYNHWLYVQDELGYITLTNQERLWIEISSLRSLDEFSLNLQRHYGLDSYHAWLEENGVTILQSNTNHHFGLRTRLTAEEAALLMYGVYHYFLTETPNAVEFRENMINNEAPFIVSDNFEVASKTGWLFPQRVRHDVAIVEAPSPYILVILSQEARTAHDLPYNEPYYFRMLSQLFEDFNNRFFVME